MGVTSGCGCKEVYTFLHITYPYILLLYNVLFCSSIPTFSSLKKMFLILGYIYNYFSTLKCCILVFAVINVIYLPVSWKLD